MKQYIGFDISIEKIEKVQPWGSKTPDYAIINHTLDSNNQKEVQD